MDLNLLCLCSKLGPMDVAWYSHISDGTAFSLFPNASPTQNDKNRAMRRLSPFPLPFMRAKLVNSA